MRMRSVLTHTGEALFEGFLIALLVVGLMVGTTFAGKGDSGTKGGGKPSGGGSVTLTIHYVDDIAPANTPNLGDTISFDFQQSITTEPFLDLTCSQGGTVVYGATTGYFDSYAWPWTKNMKLGSQMWTTGDAQCTAVLYMFYGGGKKQTLGTLRFTALG
jgi:hypothetical protein